MKDGSTWRYLKVENWDLTGEKNLCQHLGFEWTGKTSIESRRFGSGYTMAVGDLVCYYRTQQKITSCCVHLVIHTVSSPVFIPKARCEYGLSAMCEYR